ncbi:peptidoglycan -binding protein [Niveispirillum sp. SYP-B3756]|uniref:peptidoglycan -binding protein n=1 Tax=Niveispirillum sp. SYP-B3756 TaxID=2662178 RepID=UPI001291D859|nr:peptidoglycan -binding protein [Niveispirillum sp. SYP-B3756]MQP67087.1 peptidoglycan -binding protein [Niveispirillum sp. SYP-B3756]
MARFSRSRDRVDIWPGWVDALSSLIMVVVFLLMVFVLGQFYLSNALAGRDRQLADLNSRIAALAEALALEKDNSAKLQGDVAALTDRLRATLSEKEQLQGQLNTLGGERDQLAAQMNGAESDKAALSAAQDQVALLNQQIAALRQQLADLATALEASETKAKAQDVQIADLGKRLNAALAGKVAELAKFRSEFFGRLREVLGNRDDVRIVGDRFVFQSEVLFDSGSADLGEAGQVRLGNLARTLLDIAGKLPKDLNWILRVDGHTDVVPIRSPRFASNWELSTARAISVVNFLISQGVPPERLAATGFGEYQPLEPGNSADALARNRRIELKLDSR